LVKKSLRAQPVRFSTAENQKLRRLPTFLHCRVHRNGKAASRGTGLCSRSLDGLISQQQVGPEFPELLSLTRLKSLITVEDFEAEMQKRVTKEAFEYVSGGAGGGLTLLENRAAFDRLRILPRALIDATYISTKTELFGRMHEFPILLAPAGYNMLMHPRGELEAVEGANLGEATMCAANFSNFTIEEISAAASRPPWFQLYVQTDRGFTKELVARALTAGCEAICVTVDVPVNGPRDRELHAGFRLPPGVQRANLRGLGEAISAAAHRPAGRNIYSATHGADATWKDIEWLRSIIPVKLLLKGVLHPEDAALSADAGCDGLIVSNHGGRSLDTVPATIDALPAIAARLNGRIPLLLDGGVRRGIDVFKALALGAGAVLIGRPYLWGLAAGGAPGVSRVLEILRTELEMTMGLAGCTTVSEITGRFILP
jgi:4-hydroxymandelate oxidase